MTVRAGMANLIQELRAMAQLGTADYSVDGVYYFGDQRLQDELDKTQIVWRDRLLATIGRQVGGSIVYFDYALPDSVGHWLEDPVGGTPVWRVFTSAGSVIGTASYTANLHAGLISFTGDQLGSATYLDCVEYDLNRAAARIWREKAGNTAAFYSFKTDNQSFNRSDWFKHCMQMAAHYDRAAGFDTVLRKRGDMLPAGWPIRDASKGVY